MAVVNRNSYEATKKRKQYERPGIIKWANLAEVTRECPEWQCSVAVPPPPAN